MPDSTKKRGPQDRARINVNERWELSYWSKKLDCSPARLRAAVRKSGVMVKDVRRALRTSVMAG